MLREKQDDKTLFNVRTLALLALPLLFYFPMPFFTFKKSYHPTMDEVVVSSKFYFYRKILRSPEAAASSYASNGKGKC